MRKQSVIALSLSEEEIKEVDSCDDSGSVSSSGSEVVLVEDRPPELAPEPREEVDSVSDSSEGDILLKEENKESGTNGGDRLADLSNFGSAVKPEALPQGVKRKPPKRRPKRKGSKSLLS